MNVIELLNAAGVNFTPKEQDNLYIECPECGKDNLSINSFSGAWHCWSMDCEAKKVQGGIHQLGELLKIEIKDFKPEKAPPKITTLSDEDRETIINSVNNKTDIIEWAVSRALDPDYVLKSGVGYDSKTRAIIFPFKDEKGNLIGAKYRAKNGDQWIKGREPDLYVLDYSDLSKEKLVIVEGEVDCATLKSMGIPCVAVLGSRKDNGYSMLRRVRQVYLGYDMDGPGEAGVEKAAAILGRYRCKRPEWTAKDPNEMLQGGATKEDFIACLASARSLATDLKSKSGKDLFKDYMANQDKVLTDRLSWGYPRLDSFTKGIPAGTVTGVLAEAGTGKTTFILNVTAKNLLDNVNVGICSLEEHATNEIMPKLAAMLIGRNPGGGRFDQQEADAIEKTLERVQLYDGDETLDDFIEWAKECYYVHNVRIIFIDYLQLLVSDESDRQQLKKDCYAIKKLVKECPKLRIIEIIQPKQQQKVVTKDGVKKNDDLDGADARGGSVINQSVDAFMTIKMVKGHTDLTQFQYTKVRGGLRVSKKDWLGQITQLIYDHATLRQTESTHIDYGG